jgi:hypothetical protein
MPKILKPIMKRDELVFFSEAHYPQGQYRARIKKIKQFITLLTMVGLK